MDNLNYKYCIYCKKDLPKSEFYKNKATKDGLMRYCKNCDRLYRRKMRKKHPETYKARDKRYYANNREKKLEYLQEWRNRNKAKMAAHSLVRSAIRKGVLVKKPCFCGETETDAHHEDYSKPLEVQWLCRRHHVLIHS